MKSPIINPIIKYDLNFYWIETYFLDKVNEKEFTQLTHLDFHDFDEAISYGLKSVSENTSKKKPKNFSQIAKSSFYQELQRLGKEFDLLPGDLGRISSWGCKDNKVFLIDAGLSKQVYSDFYDTSSSTQTKEVST